MIQTERLESRLNDPFVSDILTATPPSTAIPNSSGNIRHVPMPGEPGFDANNFHLTYLGTGSTSSQVLQQTQNSGSSDASPSTQAVQYSTMEHYPRLAGSIDQSLGSYSNPDWFHPANRAHEFPHMFHPQPEGQVIDQNPSLNSDDHSRCSDTHCWGHVEPDCFESGNCNGMELCSQDGDCLDPSHEGPNGTTTCAKPAGSIHDCLSEFCCLSTCSGCSNETSRSLSPLKMMQDTSLRPEAEATNLSELVFEHFARQTHHEDLNASQEECNGDLMDETVDDILE